MNIKHLKIIENIHSEIITIDSEILQMEKLANEISNDNCTLELSVKVNNHDKPEAKTTDEMMPSDFVHMKMRHTIFSLVPQPITHSFTVSNNYNFNFSDTDCLRVLDVIIKIKYNQRNILINQIRKLGVNL